MIIPNLVRRLLLGVLLPLAGSAGFAQQQGDPEFEPKVERPSFARAEGPVVAIDEGHHNFHTLSGRYAPFAKLLEADGYRLRPHRGALRSESLAGIDVLVVANALHASNAKKWELPTPSAFTAAEIDAVVAFVEGGGSLFLIADHMPFPGAVDELARRFGAQFENGFNAVRNPGGGFDVGRVLFRRETGGIAKHPITEGRGGADRVAQVASFTGSVFRLDPAVEGAAPLLVLGEGSFVLNPRQAWKFAAGTPSKDVSGWLQGAAIERGKGRVAVFAEAAMFTAQRTRGRKMGMTAPIAKDNQALARNILRWLVFK